MENWLSKSTSNVQKVRLPWKHIVLFLAPGEVSFVLLGEELVCVLKECQDFLERSLNKIKTKYLSYFSIPNLSLSVFLPGLLCFLVLLLNEGLALLGVDGILRGPVKIRVFVHLFVNAIDLVLVLFEDQPRLIADLAVKEAHCFGALSEIQTFRVDFSGFFELVSFDLGGRGLQAHF